MNLWHTSNEEPEKGKEILVERIDFSNNKKIWTTDSANTLYDSWKTKAIKEKIIRWLYIEDLLE